MVSARAGSLLRGKSRSLVMAILALSILLALVFLGGPRQREREHPPVAQGLPTRGGEFRVFDYSGLRSWDPHEVADIVSAIPVSQVYEGLVQYSPGDPTQLAPALAERWEVAADGRAYTFHLRSNARFANDPCFPGGRGRRVTAGDVNYSLERAFARGGRAVLPSAAWEIEGAPDYTAGRSTSLAGVAALDESTVVIRLRRPRAAFMHFLALNGGYLVPPEADAFYGQDLGVHPVGAGPFRLARWEPEAAMTLVRNENYWERDAWGQPLPYLDRLVLVISSPRNLPGEGGPHAMGSMPPASMEWAHAWAQKHGLQYFQTSRCNTIFLGWRMDRDNVWARNRLLRQAVSCAIPRPTGPHRTPAHGLLPPGVAGHDLGLARQEEAPERARRLLALAGHPGGRGLPRLVLSLPEDEPMPAEIAALRDLGIDVEPSLRPRPEHWACLEAGRTEFFRGGWVADYPDPENFFEIFYSRSPLNRTRFTHAAYDSLFERLVEESDEKRRGDLCSRLQEILTQESPAVFLRHDVDVLVALPEVRNFGLCVNPLSRKFYKYVWLAGGEVLP